MDLIQILIGSDFGLDSEQMRGYGRGRREQQKHQFAEQHWAEKLSLVLDCSFWALAITVFLSWHHLNS